MPERADNRGMSTPDTSIHGPDYRPSNVRIVRIEADDYYYGRATWRVLDFDGTTYFQGNRSDAERHARVRKGVIKAALTRRANKARREAAGR